VHSVKPKVSYIVSCYDRPRLLPICLHSLLVQSDDSLEIIVTDNSTDANIAKTHKAIVSGLKDARVRYISTAGKTKISDCYWSAEYGARQAKGEWLCFPCDDCYYVPEFQERMLDVAKMYAWDLVLCDAVYRYNVKRYAVLNMKPSMNIASKSSFLVSRKVFPGFRAKPQGNASPCAADAALIGDLVRAGVSSGTVQDVMVVHN
jgi:glycosyltransferase involved in cell wall biosynthesis